MSECGIFTQCYIHAALMGTQLDNDHAVTTGISKIHFSMNPEMHFTTVL